MPLNINRSRILLKECNLSTLFIEEMGWEPSHRTIDLDIEGNTYTLSAIAEKRGFVVWISDLEDIPDHKTRVKIERKLTETSFEHVIVFITKDQSRQFWMWVRRESSKPLAVRCHEYNINQSGDSLLQKLNPLYISIEDEEAGLSTIELDRRARAAFDVEKVTRSFYHIFDERRNRFLSFIKGIPNEGDAEWYASVMLNRLMFVYFIQRKGFLDGDYDYLKNRLERCRNERGKDKFYTFYRYFLLKLFHEGFGKRRAERSAELERLLGNIPYLNGGLFDVHELERPERYGNDIKISDVAFEEIFAYFDQYSWHLDDRPLKNDNEINPDVLGYIFEKYINQKQMGAFYTKEDITEYISKSTIIPYILESTSSKCTISFKNDNEHSIWNNLIQNPGRYINPSLRHGVDLELPSAVLNDEPCQGIQAPSEYALPAETWREVIYRREHYNNLRKRLYAGEIKEINELVTLNLDLRQFAQDIIETCEGTDLLAALWDSVSTISILDPTGGSGAFLFAALNVLEPLYEACLERMETFLTEWGDSGASKHPNYYRFFKEILDKVNAHPNRRYFVLKSIVLNNLYAVDIMEEAVEICKLRLFLKLASQVEADVKKDNLGIEPLPDIDFNIRSGNTLVGYASVDAVRRSMQEYDTGQMRLMTDDEQDTFTKFNSRSSELANTFQEFRKLQTDSDGKTLISKKIELQKSLQILEAELNKYLAKEYGVRIENDQAFQNWIKTHQPFHWFIQFYDIIENGGFDVIIGNPPYVASTKAFQNYRPKDLVTSSCPDIYAPCIERSLNILKKNGRFGMIVPISFQFGTDFNAIRSICKKLLSTIWVSAYSRNPAALFSAGLGVRNTICLGHSGITTNKIIFSSKLQRWVEEYRPSLFQNIIYYNLPASLQSNGWLRINNQGIADLFDNLVNRGWSLNKDAINGTHPLRFKTTALYYISAFVEDPPSYESNGSPIGQTKVGSLKFLSKKIRDAALIVSLSKISLIWWAATGDDFDVTGMGLGSTPLQCSKLPHDLLDELSSHAIRIHKKMSRNIIYTKYAGKVMGNYDIKCIRDETDHLDMLILKQLGLEQYWNDIQLAYAQFLKATGERHGTVRQYPFD